LDLARRRLGRPALHPPDPLLAQDRARRTGREVVMRPGRILDRYVSREFLRLFLLFALAAPVLFVLGDLMDNLDRFMERGLTARQVGLNYLYQLPLFILYSFPIASLIAAVFTVNTMTGHSEVVAAKAGGVSFFR